MVLTARWDVALQVDDRAAHAAEQDVFFAASFQPRLAKVVVDVVVVVVDVEVVRVVVEVVDRSTLVHTTDHLIEHKRNPDDIPVQFFPSLVGEL
jgi:hypothetical protein